MSTNYIIYVRGDNDHDDYVRMAKLYCLQIFVQKQQRPDQCVCV